MSMKHIIWTNDFSRYSEDDIREAAAENLNLPVEEVTDSQMFDEWHDECDINYDAERCNLDRELAGRIICIADLGLWNGHKSGYRIMSNNLNSVLNAFVGDYCTVGSDGKDIIATDAHHDGTNCYTFREINENEDIDELCDKLYDGTATDEDIAKYTKPLQKYVSEIYGWKDENNYVIETLAA